MQEIVEITVDSGAAKSSFSRTKGGEDDEIGGSICQSDPCGSRRESGTGKKCTMKFLDAHVKRPLAFVRATVAEGNMVVFGAQESCVENTSTGQRIPTNRRRGVVAVQLDARAGARSTKTCFFRSRRE